jgi:CRP-like cAMP-binding protein
MKAEQLKEIEVLESMDAEARARLAAVLEEKDYTDGQTVFAEGDPGDSMYFLVSGRIRVEKRAQTAGGTTKTLAVLEAGDYFGEMALLDQKPRSAAAVAAGPVKILRLSKTSFDDLQRTNSAAGMSVLFAMIRTSSDRIRRLSAQLVVYDEVGKAIGEAPDLQSLLDVILQQLASATNADWGLLLLHSQFGDELELRSQLNLSLTPAQRQALSSGKGCLAPILQNPQEHLVTNFDEDAAFKSCERLGFETPSMLIAPVLHEGQVLGLIILGGKERAQLDLNALNLARGIARQAAQAILNARHREEESARTRHSKHFVQF